MNPNPRGSPSALAGPRRRGLPRLGSIERWYLVIALLWGVAQVFLVPPFQVPDEGDHWFRAWSVSSGQLVPDSHADITLPGEFKPAADLYLGIVGGLSGLEPLPTTLDGVRGFSGYATLFAGPPGPDIQVPSRVANYGPLGYLPQAVAIDLGRAVGASPLADFYLARLANLLVCAALIGLAIRLTPFGKEAFLLIGLLPMTMFEVASVSCDALTLAGALLFTALALRAAFQAKVRRADAAVLVLAAAVLLNIKPGYWSLVLLLALVPAASMAGQWRKWALIGGSALVSALGFALIYAATTGSRVGVGESHSQLAVILADPVGFLGIVAATLQSQWLVLILEAIGILGWLTVWLVPPAYFAAVLAVPAQVFRGPGTPSPSALQRAWIAAVALTAFMTMAVALYAFLSPPGATMFGTQGRYFEPVALLLLLALSGIKVTQRPRAQAVAITAVLVLMAANFASIVGTYWVAS